jgi:hypothetical protein
VECCHGWAGCPGGDGRHHFVACRQNRGAGAGKLPDPARGLSPSPTSAPRGGPDQPPDLGTLQTSRQTSLGPGPAAGAWDPPRDQPPPSHAELLARVREEVAPEAAALVGREVRAVTRGRGEKQI